MSSFYSQRHAPVPIQLRYDVPNDVRQRIWAIVEQHIGRGRDARPFLDDLANLLRQQYGVLAGPDAHARLVIGPPEVHAALEHLQFCSDEHSLDFFEACFRLNHWSGGQSAVTEINRAFQQSGIGYQLTDYRGSAMPRGGVRIGGRPIPEEQLPRIIRVDHQWTHQEVIVPALQLLTNPAFEVANREFLAAHADHRAGRHDDAITKCGSAFESVLKTICTSKGWPFDANATLAPLIHVCAEHGLFPAFYEDLLTRTATVRNRLGDAHGRGPAPAHDVDSAHAEHMLSMTAAHIVLLASLGGMA